jgi:hypothetical protein
VRISKVLSSCIIGLALSASASAEIYESKDAQGNTVYSDMPSQGAAAIKVPPTNSADPVAVTPRPPAPPETPAKPRKTPARTGTAADEESDVDWLHHGGYYNPDENGDQTRREKRRDEEDTAKPKRERPVVTPQRNVSRPAGGSGAGRR